MVVDRRDVGPHRRTELAVVLPAPALRSDRPRFEEFVIARRQPNPCLNMNHRRTDAPVSHCPQCGTVVNARIARRQCTQEAHATARRQQSIFCAHCGEQLVRAR